MSSANISLPHQRRTMMQLLFAMIAGGTPVDGESEQSEQSDEPADDAAVVSAAEISAIGQCVLGLVRTSSDVLRRAERWSCRRVVAPLIPSRPPQMFELCELLETAGEFSQTTRALRKENVCEELYREAGDRLRTQLDTLAKQCHCLQVAATAHLLSLVWPWGPLMLACACGRPDHSWGRFFAHRPCPTLPTSCGWCEWLLGTMRARASPHRYTPAVLGAHQVRGPRLRATQGAPSSRE